MECTTLTEASETTTPTIPSELEVRMHETRYTPDEMFDKYFNFLKDADTQARLKKRNIRTWEHEELLLRFFAYVKTRHLLR
jgi:hypothetical protein